MATATRTFSQFRGNNIPTVHTGLNVVGGALSRSVTLSPSGRLKMWQVPNKATIVDYFVRIQAAEDDNGGTFQMGTSQTRSGIMSVISLTATISLSASASLDTLQYNIRIEPIVLRAGAGTRGVGDGTNDLMPVKISLSDDAQPQSVWVIGTLGTGVSASAYFTGMMYYLMDGMPGHTTIR